MLCPPPSPPTTMITATTRTSMLRTVFHSVHSPAIVARQLATAATSTPNTISAAIAADRHKLATFHHKLLEPTTTDERARFQNQFCWELARHAVGVEIVVLPAYERHLGALGKRAAERSRSSHQEIKNRLEYFQRIYPTSHEFGPKLQELVRGITEAQDTERREKLLNRLENAMHEDGVDSAKLARSFERTKWFIPTRAHPWAPDRPPYESVVAFLSAPIDKLADIFRRFPSEEDVRHMLETEQLEEKPQR